MRRGISSQIYLDTFADIALWAHEYFIATGTPGIGEVLWLMKHLRMEIFRLGSLQFELSSASPAVLPPQADGFTVLNVHIPKGADLSPAAVSSSYQAALQFWQLDCAVIMCHSWLLSPALPQLLPPSSRILSFSRQFSFLEADENDRQAEERIFGGIKANPQQYQENTSLQNAAKAYLLTGKSIPLGAGWQLVKRQTARGKV